MIFETESFQEKRSPLTCQNASANYVTFPTKEMWHLFEKSTKFG